MSEMAMSEPVSTSTDVSATAAAAQSPAPKSAIRKYVSVAVKVVLSGLILFKIYSDLLARDGATEALARLAELRWGWFALAMTMQLVAIGFGVVRWRVLLSGQGIRAPWSFLGTSWMIGRFWGAVTPGGLGLDGWRLYETARYTDKPARAAALSGVEKVLGQLGFGLVVLAGSVFGLQFIGVQGLILVNGFFAVIVAAGLTLLARPQIFRAASRILPKRMQVPIATLVEAVCAYHGKGKLLVTAALLGMGVHAFNNLIYVCAARAIGVDLHPGAVFFASSLQIMATLLPASINGIGLREMAAVALYTSAAVGLSMSEAVLIPTVGFAAEMAVSSTGMLFFILARRPGYAPAMQIDNPEREQVLLADQPVVPEEKWPVITRGAWIGLGAGMLAGLIIGVGEGAVIVAGGRTGSWVMAYGAVAYTLFCGVAGAVGGAILAWQGRYVKREATAEPLVYARLTGLLVFGLSFGLGAFRVRRDIFEEELVWKSLQGLGVLLACVGAAAIVGALVSLLVFQLVKRAKILMKPWGTPAAVGTLIAITAGVTLGIGEPARAELPAPSRTAPAGAGNVLVIVVDTMRADHLPGYGYAEGSTPNLDAFARDSIRFDQAFANASWTRPSFASILSGRYPSSHSVMAKGDALPAAVVTMPEAFRDAGWHTHGVVTNYNVGPYYQFDQGFDVYDYLEPDFVLGADDSAAKLLLVQFLRQRVDGLRAALHGGTPRSAVYQDAEIVNRSIFEFLDGAPSDQPFMLFVGYMDPHDPYYGHPGFTEGYGRAAHQEPRPDEAEHLRELYDGEITYWDEHFGALIRELQRRGLYDDLTIVVTSDHGEEFHEHGGFWHGTTLYDEQVRVPLYVHLPGGRRAGTTVRHWVQSVDIMPTLLSEAGLEIPEGVQGGNFFEGTTRVYAEESHEGNILESVRELRGTDEIKLIVANAGNPRRLGERELYRVDLDPGETEDVSESAAAALEVGLHALDAARISAQAGAVEGAVVDDEGVDRCQLCQLGYLTGESCNGC